MLAGLDRWTQGPSVQSRPVTSLEHQVWRRVFWEGTTFFKLCPTHFSRGAKKILQALPLLRSSGKVVTATPRTPLAQVFAPFACWGKLQVANLSSGLLNYWLLLRNNNTAEKLQMFTSSYGGRRFAACDQGSHWCFFPPRSVFWSTCVSRLLWKIAWNLCCWSNKHISNFNVFNNIRITLHYSVYMRTSGEKVRISDEAERVQSVSYSHIRSLSGLYTVVSLREDKRGTYHGPPLQLCNAVVGNHRAAARCRSVRSSLPGRITFQVKCFETFL